MLVAAMGSGGDKNNMTLGLCSDLSHEVETLLPASAQTACYGTPVGLINDDKFGTFQLEVGGPSVALDEVRRYDNKAVAVED